MSNRQDNFVTTEEPEKRENKYGNEADIKIEEWVTSHTDSESDKPEKIDGLVIGTLAGITQEGQILVEHPFNTTEKPVPAGTLHPVAEVDIGKEVGILFESGDPGKPVLLGVMHQQVESIKRGNNGSVEEKLQELEARIDGKTVTLDAEKEIVLRCGKASITLTRAGKILIRGKYLLSHSSGVNRIKGGSVQIN